MGWDLAHKGILKAMIVLTEALYYYTSNLNAKELKHFSASVESQPEVV